MNYSYLYKKRFSSLDELSVLGEYDYYLSMFAPTERVMTPAEHIQANEKIWLVLPEEKDDLFLVGKTTVEVHLNDSFDIIQKLIKDLNLAGKRLCVDATGIHIPYLLFILRMLHYTGVKKFDVLYAEPQSYVDAEETDFSDEFYNVRQILGLSGKHTSETSNDLLIIAAGYDHSRIIDVATNKKYANKVLMFGFPSMSAEMFQENIIRAYNASEAVDSDCFKDMSSNILAPANDPFVTAQMIKEYIENRSKREKITHVYLAPLSSKPQALGIGLYYIAERCWLENQSIIYPFCEKYYRDNAIGVSGVWQYQFEFPW